MKVVMLKEGMERTGEYINRLCTAKENGLIDIDAIPTATDILLELIKKAKVTANGYVIVQGIMFIKGQDYELEADEFDLAVNELKKVKGYINKLSIVDYESGDDYIIGKQVESFINKRIKELSDIDKELDNGYIYNGELKILENI